MKVEDLLYVLASEIKKGKIKKSDDVLMFSDEEGNNINNLFEITREKGRIFLVPDTALLEL